MSSHPVLAVTLKCHPESPGDAVRGIGARVSRTPAGMLAVTYTIEGDIDRLRVPARRPPCVTDRLWEHTCCEIFIACHDLPAYLEFNLSPSGEWAAYAFQRYRDGARLADESNAEALNPRIAMRDSAKKLELDALIRLDRLSPVHRVAKLSLALSAVVEEKNGLRSYWAIKHPPGTPDFHHAEGFALELEEMDCGIAALRPPTT